MTDQGAGRQRPAGWKKDPSGRHFGRYWDGAQWTQHVISAEKVQSIDPLPPRPAEVQRAVQPHTDPAPTKVAQVVAPTAVLPTTQVDAPRSLGEPVPARPLPGRAWDGFRRWPRWAQWAVGIFVGLVIIGAATGGEDDTQPVSVVGQVSTTVSAPAAAAEPATTEPPATQAPTTATSVAPTTTRLPATTAATAPATTAATAPATTAATAPATTGASSVFYANCAAVRAAGRAPIRRGEPGYSSALDRDGDGIACET